jgi:hypothetical protein
MALASGAGAAQETPDREEGGSPLLVIPFLGMSNLWAPDGSGQTFGLHLVWGMRSRLGVDAWARSYALSGDRRAVLGGDFLLEMTGRTGRSGVSLLAGFLHGLDRNAGSVALRGHAAISPETLDQEAEGVIPPLQLWMEIRGGVGTLDRPRGTRTTGFGMVTLAMALVMRPGTS